MTGIVLYMCHESSREDTRLECSMVVEAKSGMGGRLVKLKYMLVEMGPCRDCNCRWCTTFEDRRAEAAADSFVS